MSDRIYPTSTGVLCETGFHGNGRIEHISSGDGAVCNDSNLHSLMPVYSAYGRLTTNICKNCIKRGVEIELVEVRP